MLVFPSSTTSSTVSGGDSVERLAEQHQQHGRYSALETTGGWIEKASEDVQARRVIEDRTGFRRGVGGSPASGSAWS